MLEVKGCAHNPSLFFKKRCFHVELHSETKTTNNNNKCLPVRKEYTSLNCCVGEVPPITMIAESPKRVDEWEHRGLGNGPDTEGLNHINAAVKLN